MIFGLLGCPAMGIRGAAIATVIGQMVGAVAALLFNRFHKPGNADSRYSCIEDYFRFFCYVCNYNPVRLFYLWTWKWHHQYGWRCYTSTHFTGSQPLDFYKNLWHFTWLVCILDCRNRSLRLQLLHVT